MSVSGVRSLLYRAARLLGDYQAVRRGRVPERLFNRILGRFVAGLLRGLWR